MKPHTTEPEDDPKRQSVDGPIMADPDLDAVDLDGLSESEVSQLSLDDLEAIRDMVEKEITRRTR